MILGVTCLAAGRATPGSAIAALLHSSATLRNSATLLALRIPNARLGNKKRHLQLALTPIA